MKVRGTVDAPQLLADITGPGAALAGAVGGPGGTWRDVKSTDQIGGSLDVRVDRISQPGVNISLVQLNAKGNEKQHDLQLRVQGDPVSGQLSLAGSFDRKAERWRGTLSNTRFQTPVGPVALTRNIALDYRNLEQKISIGPHWTKPERRAVRTADHRRRGKRARGGEPQPFRPRDAEAVYAGSDPGQRRV